MIDEKELSKVLDKWSDFWGKKTDGRSKLKWTTLLRVRALVNHFPKVNDWILCSERMPEENQNVIDCFAHGTVTELAFYNGKFHGVYAYDEKVIIAWQPLPEPYKTQDS